MTGEDGTVAWRELLAEATERLAAVAAAPGSEARWIVEEASGSRADEVLGVLDEAVTRRGMVRFDTMVQRRLAGEPLQYVLGRWAFRSLDLLVDRRVLIPRPETEVVVEHALALHDELGAGRDAPLVVADLGTGSGAIALSFAVERPGVEVWATDVSEEALAVARANLAGIGRRAVSVTLAAGSWFDALPDTKRGTVDLVVTNPPYIGAAEELPDEVREWEPELALIGGERGTEPYERIFAEAPGWLGPGGALVAEIAPHHREELSERAAVAFDDVAVLDDLAGRPRILVARLVRERGGG